jgi:integrase
MASRLRKKAQGWGARIRFGEKLARDEWIHLDVPHEEELLARDRLVRLQVMAKRLADIGQHDDARAYLEEAGKTRHERGFRAIEVMVEEMAPPSLALGPPKTFRQVVQDLCDGTLCELYPEDVIYRTKAGRDARRTKLATFFPVLGDKTFDQITQDDIDKAKQLIPRERNPEHPDGIRRNTRVVYCRELRYVVNELAVEVMRLCEHTPRVKVPKSERSDVPQVLHPDEEALVAGAVVAISLEERFLYAWLARNGTRISETLQYTWECIDLDKGTIRVRKEWTKTGESRFWMLEPDVLEALRLRRRMIPDAVLVFVPPPLRVLTRGTVQQQLHPNLRKAGLDRQELFEPPDGERPISPHAFRGSFVTLCRALGLPDRWIMDRTGHESVKEFEKYDRGMRHARAQALEWWAPMALALRMPGANAMLPGLEVLKRLGPNPVQSWAKAYQTPRKPPIRTFRCEKVPDASNPFSTGTDGVEDPSIPPVDPLGPAQISISGQRSQSTQNVPPEPPGLAVGSASPQLDEHELALMHELASGQKKWALAAKLAQSLEAIRLSKEAAAPPNVASLDDARRRRDEGGGK